MNKVCHQRQFQLEPIAGPPVVFACPPPIIIFPCTAHSQPACSLRVCHRWRQCRFETVCTVPVTGMAASPHGYWAPVLSCTVILHGGGHQAYACILHRTLTVSHSSVTGGGPVSIPLMIARVTHDCKLQQHNTQAIASPGMETEVNKAWIQRRSSSQGLDSAQRCSKVLYRFKKVLYRSLGIATTLTVDCTEDPAR